MEVKKWSLFDVSAKGNRVYLRFDELAKMVADGSIQNSDLVRSPQDKEFIPVRSCDRLSYYCLKRRLTEKSNPFMKIEELFVNPRLFSEEGLQRQEGPHVEKKKNLFERFKKQILLLLDTSESILLLTLPFSQSVSAETQAAEKNTKVEKGRMLLVFTEKRILKLSFDDEYRYLSDIKYTMLKDVDSFSWKDEFFSHNGLRMVLKSGEVLFWKGIKKYERERIDVFLRPFIEWSISASHGKAEDAGGKPFLPEQGKGKLSLRKDLLSGTKSLFSGDNARIAFELVLLYALMLVAIRSHFARHELMLSLVSAVFVIEAFLAKVYAFAHRS